MSFMVFVRDLIFAAAMVLLPLAISLTAAQADPLFIHYECDLAAPSSTDMSPCPTNPGPRDTVYKVLTGTPDPSNPDRLLCPETGSGSFCAARSSVGNAVAPVSAWGKCYWIDNHSTRNLFVPFRTETEWSSFISSAQSGQLGNIVLTPCTPPSSDGSGTITIGPPYDQCNSATIHTPPVYGRYNSSIWPVPENTSPDTPAFTCHNGATSVQSLLQYNAGDPSASGDAQMLWTPDFIFSPDLNLTATDGISIGTSISVNSGEAVALSWTTGSDPNPLYTSQTYSCAATDSLSAYWSSPFQGVVATQASPNGAVVLTPPGTSVYTLTCTNSKALISKSTVTVNVSGACGNAAKSDLHLTAQQRPLPCRRYGLGRYDERHHLQLDMHAAPGWYSPILLRKPQRLHAELDHNQCRRLFCLLRRRHANRYPVRRLRQHPAVELNHVIRKVAHLPLEMAESALG